MKKLFFCFAIVFPLFVYMSTGILHAAHDTEKRLGQKFIDAMSAKDEDMMRQLIKENKDAVPQEVEMMLSYATENKVGWMVDVCNKMASLYKDETGDDSLLKKVEKATAGASGEDPNLTKLKDEVVAIGKGHWSINIMEYNNKVLKMEINVDPDIGLNIDKKDVATVGKTIEQLLPEAHGNITWSSIGIGVASLLKDEDSKTWKTSKDH